MKFVDPKSDIAFKKIFANETKKEILLSFLNAILNLTGDKTIVDVEILNPYQAPRITELKETILDVRAKDKKGITFIVEMQVEKQVYFDKRVLYYASKAYVNQIDKGMEYPRLNQVIFIGILNFSIFNQEHYLSQHMIMDKITGKQELKDLEFVFIELPKFNKTETELITIMDKWIYFLKNADNLKVIPENTTDLPLKEAYETVNKFQWSKEELDVYDYWSMREGIDLCRIESASAEGEAKGEARGKVQGIAEGKAQGIVEGKAQGIVEGEARGEARGKANGLIEAKKRLIDAGISEVEAKKILGL